mgnify:CR=1 FL=1
MALFREYDLRGVVGEELTEAIAEQVGRAYATMAREQGASRISLGRAIEFARLAGGPAAWPAGRRP